MASETAGGALAANSTIHLFHGRNVHFYFRVPAKAKEVLVNLLPEEPGEAKLYGAAGKLIDEMPYQTAGKVLKGTRSPTADDEIWLLEFPKLQEDFRFQVGGDAVPLLSTEREGVILGKTVTP